MGGGQGSGPSNPDGVGPLGLICYNFFLLWPVYKKEPQNPMALQLFEIIEQVSEAF